MLPAPQRAPVNLRPSRKRNRHPPEVSASRTQATSRIEGRRRQMGQVNRSGRCLFGRCRPRTAGMDTVSSAGRWCCRGGLNSRPQPYQGCALPLSYGSTARVASGWRKRVAPMENAGGAVKAACGAMPHLPRLREWMPKPIAQNGLPKPFVRTCAAARRRRETPSRRPRPRQRTSLPSAGLRRVSRAVPSPRPTSHGRRRGPAARSPRRHARGRRRANRVRRR